MRSSETTRQRSTPSSGRKTESNGHTFDTIHTYTVEDAIEAIGFGWFQLKIFFVGKLISAADSMEMMMLSVLSPLVRCEWQLEDYKVAFITTAVFIGMGISAPLFGIVGDNYGRKPTLIMVTVWIGFFGFLATFSPTYSWIVLLRGLVGVGMGGSPQGFSLTAEYVPSKYRAKLLVFGTIFWTIGGIFEILLAMIVVPALGWRWLLVFSAIPVLLASFGLLFIPESARFLAGAGYIDDAEKILEKAAKINKAKLPDGKLTQSQNVPLGRLKDVFSREYLRSTLQLWFLWFGVAFTYYGMVLANAEVLRIRNEESTSKCKCVYLTTDDYLTMILSSFGELISLPINFLLFDKIGRRFTGALCYFGAGLFFVLLQLQVELGVLTVFMFFVRGFATACFNFVYIYSSELYPTSIRTLSIGMASAMARVGAMLTPFISQVLISQSVASATWVYGSICLLCCICCLLLPIETKGRALPQSLTLEYNEIELSQSSNALESEEDLVKNISTIEMERKKIKNSKQNEHDSES
ncbi:putative transporter SVOPL [Biomphalaria glabrata]|uniref:Transporter SVOPL n=1 Tax=Biomphalaria glabrata TaxID=6526 RepID=A0A9W2YFB7_BIOGL|nr:putative transporter SVOPL [Biomphalaria glabrata]XP_055861504.1 putative transporter SVOPL [Biomphalaria glabrata]XP_055861505.1 putative transporter SVOPL [Biomphalaria glabrata]XP_055861506.1 putative transporter SVOPL [Biomphalaria glabrata]